MTDGTAIGRRRGQPKGKRELLTDDNFKVAQLAFDLGITLHRLAKELGLNPASCWYWKKGRRRPGAPESAPLEAFIPSSSLIRAKEYLLQVKDERTRSLQSAEDILSDSIPVALT